MLSFFEAIILLIAWAGFVLIGVLICGLLGAGLMAIMEPYLGRASANLDQTGEKENSVLIRVVLRTPLDAKDIAQEWEEIGGEVVQLKSPDAYDSIV